MLHATSFLLLPAAVMGCSNFMLTADYRISGRTMDVGDSITSWALESRPAQSLPADGKYGYVRFFNPTLADANLTEGGMNEVGLSCDMQHLNNSTYPNATGTAADVWVGYLCDHALAHFGGSLAFGRAVSNGDVHFHGAGVGKMHDQHFVLRDAKGESVVIEFLRGVANVYQDANDGESGFGILTNEPPYEWQVQNVQHHLWKQSLARPAATYPGTFYPDERFLRLHEVKSSLRPPSSYDEAVMQAVFVLNVVTVPPGRQLGTDTAAGSVNFDHTNFGVVYDHKLSILYWRSEFNMNLQRLRLSDVPLAGGAPRKKLNLHNALPWFEDAAHVLV